jgi:hypothetical protein
MTASVADLGPGPAVAGAESPPESPVDRVIAAVTKQPLHREIHYRTLGFCRERRALAEVEEEIATCPEFKFATQNPYRLISFLADAGGLDRLELDDDGQILTAERKAGLSEDEIDDLVSWYAYVTTAAGVAAFDELDPRKRISELLGSMSEHTDTLAQVLEFCEASRTYKEIEDLLESSGLDWSGTESDETAVHPSFFVSTLERVGALAWNDGWLATDEGRAMLESLRKAS